jgi:hypothetical protein
MGGLGHPDRLFRKPAPRRLRFQIARLPEVRPLELYTVSGANVRKGWKADTCTAPAPLRTLETLAVFGSLDEPVGDGRIGVDAENDQLESAAGRQKPGANPCGLKISLGISR